jgi:putative transposase
MSGLPLSLLSTLPKGAVALMEEHFHALNLPLAGRNYVRNTFQDGPSRAVSNKFGNTVVKHCSPKAGMVRLESRTGELAAAIDLDVDKDVVTYAVQAQASDLLLTNAEGKVTGRVQYRPDFAILTKSGIEIREQRDESLLIQRMIQNPWQFYLDETGQWHYRGAESFFEKLGLPFRIRTNQSLPDIFINNALFLEDYHLESCPPLDQAKAFALRRLVADARFLSIRSLLDDHGFDADTIFKAVAAGVVYVDLRTDRLDVTHDLNIFSDQATSKALKLVEVANMAPPLPIPGTLWIRSDSQITYGGKTFTVILSGERDVAVRDSDGLLSYPALDSLKKLHDANMLTGDGIRSSQDPRTLAEISPGELERALHRLDAARKGSSDEFAQRTVSKFITKTESLHPLEALLALVDRQKHKGNRNGKLPSIVETLAQEAIKIAYNTADKPSYLDAFGIYQDLCTFKAEELAIEIVPMSYITFIKRCKSLESVKAREGKRSAYQKTTIVQALNNLYPVHGVRPYEVLYIDHTPATIATVSPEGVDLGKPTLTVAIDGNVRKPRAMVLTYDPPSAALVLLALRDCVRRNGRLPDKISVDNGSDFRSQELEDFCRIFGIDLQFRAPGEPRGGAMIERLLGATEEEIFSSMQGNTKQMRDPRLVTQSVNPFNRAVWTLTAVHGALEEYLFDTRPNRPHPALGMTPNEYEKKRQEETGERAHRLVKFDENIMLLTSPHPKRAFHKLCKRRGIWVGHQWYRHPAMDLLEHGTRLEVRVERWLYSVIYVLINSQWRAAVGGNARNFDGKSRREVEVAFREQARVAGLKARKHSVSKEGLRYKAKLLDPRFYDARIGAQQVEMRYLYSQLKMMHAMSIPTELLCISAPPETLNPIRLEAGAEGIFEPTTTAVAPAMPPSTMSAADSPTASGSASAPAQSNTSLEGIFDDIAGYN